jgi:hypothetical protein
MRAGGESTVLSLIADLGGDDTTAAEEAQVSLGRYGSAVLGVLGVRRAVPALQRA